MKIRSQIIIIGLVSTLLASGINAYAAPKQNVKQMIQAVCNQADTAAKNKDVNAAVACYADPALQGAVKKGLEHLLKVTQSPTFHTRVISVDLGKTKQNAVVIIVQHFQGIVTGSKGSALGIMHAKVRQYWVRRGPGWAIYRSKVLTMKRTLNNKPVNSF